ncbi:hypothetical protein N864_18360 [Intrasporangium chromatireducens Q5-1]|uniref:Uncharacterized protein n=1 Tax=Intrasporangium chromatireducens Q5-1 TaxID=584657 RepID=W9GS68_9MICO|nr:hypothetical protein N864_18360 [Intrasporangium chromatireducens Q5-1]
MGQLQFWHVQLAQVHPCGQFPHEHWPAAAGGAGCSACCMESPSVVLVRMPLGLPPRHEPETRSGQRGRQQPHVGRRPVLGAGAQPVELLDLLAAPHRNGTAVAHLPDEGGPLEPLGRRHLRRVGTGLLVDAADEDGAQLPLDDPVHLGAVGEARQDQAQPCHTEAQLVGRTTPHGVHEPLPRRGVAAHRVGPHPGEGRLVERATGQQQPPLPVEEVGGEGEVQRGVRAVDRRLGRDADALAVLGEEHDQLLLGRRCHGAARPR